MDHTNHRVLEVFEDREKKTVMAYLQANQDGRFARREEVTCDRWGAYVNATTEVFGERVRVTIDRFQVMKNFQEPLTEARREIPRAMSKEEAQELKGPR
jgi:transposase